MTMMAASPVVDAFAKRFGHRVTTGVAIVLSAAPLGAAGLVAVIGGYGASTLTNRCSCQRGGLASPSPPGDLSDTFSR